MKPALIFGAGQVAQTFNSYLFAAGYKVSAFVVDAAHMNGEGMIDGVPVMAFEDLHVLPPSDYCFAVGMSFKGMNKPRAEKFRAMLERGYEPLTFVDPRACVSKDAKIGRGCFIMEQNVVQPFAEIGENVVLWGSSHVGHHSRVARDAFITSHVVISGACDIGERCLWGVGSIARDGVRVGADCLIGAGALILSDCEPGGVYGAAETPRSKVPSHRMRW